VRVDCGYRIDLLVGGVVLARLKAVSRIIAIHQAQMMTYLKLSGVHVGLLLNFHMLRMKDGIHRCVHELSE
jgi:GxxExxY protein